MERRDFLWISGVLTAATISGVLWWENMDSKVKTVMLASSSALKLKEYLSNPFNTNALFPGFDLTIYAENGKTIGWQREKIGKKEWLADCSPFSLVILNLALNDLLNRRPAADIFQKDFVSAYDEVDKRCPGKRISVLGAYPVSPKEEGFVDNQKEFNRLTFSFTKERGGLPIDPFVVLADANGSIKKDLTDDGIHPNLSGWKILSQYCTPQLLSFVK